MWALACLLPVVRFPYQRTPGKVSQIVSDSAPFDST